MLKKIIIKNKKKFINTYKFIANWFIYKNNYKLFFYSNENDSKF